MTGLALTASGVIEAAKVERYPMWIEDEPSDLLRAARKYLAPDLEVRHLSTEEMTTLLRGPSIKGGSVGA